MWYNALSILDISILNFVEVRFMKCENTFCIYCDQENNCILQTISLDRMGMCTQCIYIIIEEFELQRKKDRQLAEYR